MLREERFWTGTVELNYGEGPPNGPPFVILHGGAGSWRYADDLIALLVARWHVYAPDFRGHGLSGRVPGRYDLRDYAADTAAFLAGVVREPAVVYGHSLGAEVAIMAAAMQPGLFRAVIHGDVQFSRDDHPPKADEDNLQYKLHMAQNELWHRLAGRPVAEIAAALRDMPVFVPGTEEPVRAGDMFGEEQPLVRVPGDEPPSAGPRDAGGGARGTRRHARRLRPGDAPPGDFLLRCSSSRRIPPPGEPCRMRRSSWHCGSCPAPRTSGSRGSATSCTDSMLNGC